MSTKPLYKIANKCDSSLLTRLCVNKVAAQPISKTELYLDPNERDALSYVGAGL